VEHPALSVVVPVRDGAAFLPHSLSALRASDLPGDRWELIVVDDSSQDQSAEVAAPYADRLVRLVGAPSGPAVARNRGADAARGDALVFVDADVCVHPDVLRQVLEIFERDSKVSAVFGAYDLAPAARGLISQYRNLLHCYVHQRDAGDAVTFWAGCGAVRADVFARCGGFDEGRGGEALEDIELGYRMSALGHRIVLCPEIQGRHLKRWTLRSLIVTDVRHRGIPWMRLLMGRKMRPAATLNLRVSEQVCTGLVLLGCLAVFGWLWGGAAGWLAVSAGALATTVAINRPLFAWLARQRGWGFALGALPLRLLHYVLNVVSVSLALLPFRFGPERRPWRHATTGHTSGEPAPSATRN
jgi:GT2 family glycosyltransferase